MQPLTSDDQTIDPEIRVAALRLFRASDEFRRAYAAMATAPGPQADEARRRVGEAERTMDEARRELSLAERRAREHGGGPGAF